MDTTNRKSHTRGESLAPFYAVGMTVRIQEKYHRVTQGRFTQATDPVPSLGKPRAHGKRRYRLVNYRWCGRFTARGPVQNIRRRLGKNLPRAREHPVRIRLRSSCRFFLLRDDQVSDLVAIIPHVICDGFSMTYVMCDIVALLNDPNRLVTQPKPPMPVSWENIQHFPHDNLLLRVLARYSTIPIQADGWCYTRMSMRSCTSSIGRAKKTVC